MGVQADQAESPLRGADSGVQADSAQGAQRVVLIGNPNTGKTTLFNRLVGVRAKTSNFPGTTQDSRVGTVGGVELIDLPGIYSLELSLSESEVCRDVLSGEVAPTGVVAGAPDAVMVVVDACNLPRNLLLVGEVFRRRLPTVLVVNMVDLARKRGIRIDASTLSEALGCEVLLCSARSGEGVESIVAAMGRARIPHPTPPGEAEGLRQWAADRADEAVEVEAGQGDSSLTDRLDRAFTHPVAGMGAFVAIMTGFFWMIFKIAATPMDWIDGLFGTAAVWVESSLPAGVLTDLLANGVITGVGATVIFLPQICLLFFLISLLEGTGYLARAAFVMDRLLRPFGLSGHAFVPLLSSHACALPGIMAARAVPDRRDRLATILVAPFMSCTARIPVYVLLTVLLFPDRPGLQAVAFTGCYVLGVVAGLLSSLVARRTILRGKSRPMALELPSYKWPSLRSALLSTYDRGMTFLRKAGTVILMISVVLWWMGTYPLTPEPEALVAARAHVREAGAGADETLLNELATLEAEYGRTSARRTFQARLGSALEPVFAPIGSDRQLTVGILASFAAREVFVSTMAVQVAGSADTDDEHMLSQIASARRDDGGLIFTRATSWSLLVYFVLAMQCLPTLVVTAREAGGWKWAGLQLGWMSGVAYSFAFIVYQTLVALGVS
jgi:ferrous iron transport protein B